jgi:hypothetical protein
VEVDRFWGQVAVDGDHWLWAGATDKDGYGKLTVKQVTVQAHRHGWERVMGVPVPESLDLVHTCTKRACVNPEHLVLMTPRIRTLAGNAPAAINARKGVCNHGHPLEGDNLYTDPEGKRKCRTCATRIQEQRKRRFRKPRKPKPDKRTLAREIKEFTFTALGEDYGVTDTTIRNWARKYGLTWPKHAR